MGDYKDEGALAALQMDKTGIKEYFAPKYGPAVGFGYTADIYRDGHSVLKVYSPSFNKQTIFREAYAAACVEAAGVQSPAVFGVRREGGFYLTETAYVEGEDMLSMMIGSLAMGNDDTAKALLERMAKLHAGINHTECPGLPSYKAYAEDVIRHNTALTQDCRNRTLTHLGALPDAACICHGDFHPQNVLVSNDGRMSVIDWVEAGTAHPACDPARTYMNLSCLPPIPMLQKEGLNLNGTYLDAYLMASPDLTKDDILAWLPVHAAVNYGHKEPWYNEMIKKDLL